jgi:hypothetical protein
MSYPTALGFFDETYPNAKRGLFCSVSCQADKCPPSVYRTMFENDATQSNMSQTLLLKGHSGSCFPVVSVTSGFNRHPRSCCKS